MAETNKQRCGRRQKLVYWEGQIEQWTTSGLSASAYCREQGIALCQFKYWQERVSKGQTSLFVEVETTKFATYTLSRKDNNARHLTRYSHHDSNAPIRV